jgi:hypothetical protein
MNKVVKYILIALGVIAIIGIIGNAVDSKKATAKTTAATAAADSTTIVAGATKDVKEIKTNPALVNQLMAKVKIEKDEFKEQEWVFPKDKPKYRNTNGMYCYFAKDGEQVSNFRFVIQYAAEDWLFIRSYDFLIDGKPFRTYIPDNVETDNSENIWEWSDEIIDSKYQDLIEALANCKTAKVRFEGRQYYKDKEIPKKQLESIKTMYDLYVAMGGTFD